MNEDIPLLGRWIARAFQTYWRVMRGLHLFVEVCVLDEAGRTLMLREENGGSWELPGGTVRNNENLETALRRVLRDAAGVEVNVKPELLFLRAHDRNRQTAIYVVRQWRFLSEPTSPNIGFFPLADLPASANAEAAERIRRSLEYRTASKL